MNNIIKVIGLLLISILLISCGQKESVYCDKEVYNILIDANEKEKYYKIEYHIENMKKDTKIRFESNDKNICIIKDDKIYPVNIGSTEVVCCLNDNKEFTIIVNVYKNEEKKEEKLIINKLDYSLEISEEVLIEYDIENNTDDISVCFDNYDKEIIKVIDNKIIALNSGVTSIDAYLLSNKYEKITINVTVNAPKLPLIQITNEEKIVPLYGEIVLDVAIENSDDLEYSVSIDDLDIISFNNGNLKGEKIGTTKIKVSLKDNKEIFYECEFSVEVDPILLFDLISIDNVLIQNVKTFGENPKEQNQMVYGSVSYYSFRDINVIEEIVPITNNEYVGATATQDMLEKAESLKLVRSGIKLEELKYIIYHDTANINPGADAKNHADYMVSNWNKESRARSWHYTVDENVIYHHIPNDEVTWQGDSYEAYAKSIGIETCVNYGSDLYKVWQNVAKLMASLLIEYDLTVDDIKQHYDMSGKNCPQTLRMNNLYDYALSLIKGEYLIQSYLNDYKITFTSLSPNYLDDNGKVYNRPEKDTKISYMITIDGENYHKSKIYYSQIQGLDRYDFSQDPEKIKTANMFDERVANLKISLDYEEEILALDNLYDTFDEDTKRLVTTYDYLQSIQKELFILYDVDSSILINEIFISLDKENIGYNYIELYNCKDNEINLNDYKLVFKFNDDNIEYTLKDAIIKANGYYLIALGDIVSLSDVKNKYGLVLPDTVLDLNISDYIDVLEYTIYIMNDDNIIDEFSFGTGIDDFNKESIEYSISRKYFISTKNSVRDFRLANISLTNSFLKTNGLVTPTASQLKVYKYDYLIKKYDVTVTDSNKNEIINLLNEVSEIASFEKYSQTLETVKRLEIELKGLDNPDILILYQLTEKIPSQIVNDYKFPEYDGVIYMYAEDEDSSYYDIDTGRLLKISYEAKYIDFVALKNGTKLNFTINFGIGEEKDKLIYSTKAVKPNNGQTSDGYGTYYDQLNSVGFGGVAIKVNGNIYFIGKNCLISFDDSSNDTLSRKDLRPLGGEAINNVGIVNGNAKEYAGTGVLYYNGSNKDLSFDLSDTYGRNNNGAYGYFKVRFSLSSDGYYVSEILPNSGTNETTNGTICVLKPNEYLWCPHTYETNVDGGTWFMAPSSNTKGGVLTLGKALEIINYKIF